MPDYTPPRYDDVFFEGVKWLNSLDEEEMNLTDEQKQFRLDLYLYLNSTQKFFTIKLIELIQHADAFNRFKISLGFPMQCEQYELYERCATKEAVDDFFREAGIPLERKADGN